MLDIKKIRRDFPILSQKPDLIYFDSTATSLKPKSVIDKLKEYYEQYSSNIFRGVYDISEKATKEYEETRTVVSKFIRAARPEEIIFTRNTTESLNLIAYSLGREIIEKGDEVLTTIMEHHSNFVPWQQLAIENGGILKVIDITDNGELMSVENIGSTITKKTKIIALTYISNVLGTINQVKEIIRIAKQINPNIITIVDAAQAAPHLQIDVQELGCDFLAFSSHKMLGPTGVGVLWGKYDLLHEMSPFLYGGEMIQEVLLEKTTFKDTPHKFEAGTPDIAGVVAFKEAIRYLTEIGLDKIHEHELLIAKIFKNKLTENFAHKIKIIGPKSNVQSGIVSFTFNKYHPHDVAAILNEHKICVRAGHQCAMPLHKRLGLLATTRASFYLYNDLSEIDVFLLALKKVEHILG